MDIEVRFGTQGGFGNVWPVSSPERGFRKREYERRGGLAPKRGRARLGQKPKEEVETKHVYFFYARCDDGDDDDSSILSVLVQSTENPSH